MLRGTIKKLIADKGFGFIVQEVKGPDVFFHHSVVAGGSFNGLQEGDVVEFEYVDGAKGPKATNVTLV